MYFLQIFSFLLYLSKFYGFVFGWCADFYGSLRKVVRVKARLLRCCADFYRSFREAVLIFIVLYGQL